MEIISTESLNEVKGGGKTFWLIIGGLGALLSGLVAGFFNPYACNSK